MKLKPMGTLEQRPVVVKVAVPFVSPRKLAEFWCIHATTERDIKQSEESIREYVRAGNIPSFHIGKRLAVNLISHALLDAASLPYSLQVQFELLYPSLPIESFATYTGFEPGVVQGWIKNGYLPNAGLGKHRLVTLPELLYRCQHWTPYQWAALVRKTESKSQLVEA